MAAPTEASLPSLLGSRISLCLVFWIPSGIMYCPQASWLGLAFLSHFCPALFLWTQPCFEYSMVHHRKRLSRDVSALWLPCLFLPYLPEVRSLFYFLNLEACETWWPPFPRSKHLYPSLLLISLPVVGGMREHGWEQATDIVKACF